MSIAEGVDRLTSVGRWMVIIALIGLALSVGLTFGISALPGGSNVHLGLLEFVPLLIPVAIIGAVLWFSGWIVEGFAKKDP